ncbi:MAG TPA: hypothetical protein QF564_00255 [Pirellulaceae bacterium]|nr:hypothetical protein [Pirellulaceae bacterium]
MKYVLPLIAIALPLAAIAEEPVDIGSRRELFVDGLLIDKLDHVRLKLHEPRSGGVAVKYDGPADERFCFYTTILKDGDKYRMYYRGHPGTDWTKSVTCYAESADGITWTKPKLELVEVNGSRDNNAILPTGEAFGPFIDGRPGVPADERFKANMNARGGLMGYVSGDGIHWRKVREELLLRSSLPNHFDSQNVMFWSVEEECYVLYARHMVGGKRATARATSRDFLNWSDFTLMTYSDTQSTTPSQHLYTNQTQPYFRAPHIYIALPGRFQAGRRVLTDEQAKSIDAHAGGGGVNDIADGVLLTSRAGSTAYDFTFRESFVRPGIGYRSWTSRNNYPACGVVPTGPHEMSLYVQRHYGQKSAWLERMTLRTDGFVSVNAPYDGGEMVTKPLTFSGKHLSLNYSTSAAGSVRVEIQDAAGKPFDGFSATDCEEIIGDEIERVVHWKAGSNVSSLARQPVRLRFIMKDADLYSFRFVETESQP